MAYFGDYSCVLGKNVYFALVGWVCCSVDIGVGKSIDVVQVYYILNNFFSVTERGVSK